MTKKEVSQEVLEVIRQEKRDNNVVYFSDVYDYVGRVVNLVSVNTKELREGVKKVLNTNTKNPINAILGILGLQIVSKNKANKIVDSKDLSKTELGNLLELDSEKFKEEIENLTKMLVATEKKLVDDRNEKIEELNRLITQVEIKDREINQLKIDARSSLQAFADRMQYIVSIKEIHTETEEMDELDDQLEELIKDFEITIRWYDEKEENNAMYFSVVKTDSPEKHKEKPCFIYRDEVLVKGLHFII